MNIVCFLRHFNDVDHIAPILWYCVNEGDEVTAVMLNLNYDVESDPRLELLDNNPNFELILVDEFLQINMGRSLFKLEGRQPDGWIQDKIRCGLQKTKLAKRWVVPKLEELTPDVCLFEWGTPSRTSHAEFFTAASELKLPKICLPHGLNIYMNEDITPGREKAFRQGTQPMKSRNRYDAYVTQSEHDRRQEGKLGVDPENHYVLGSARYYPRWQSVNEDLYEEYTTKGTPAGRLPVVFMLPHWDYYVDRDTTLRLIERLAKADWVYLIVKEHTRGDSLPQGLDDTLVQQDNTEIVAQAASVSLIKWAEAVINFGSSIGIEALLQETPHINPSYLHSNTTIFDETNAGYQPESNPESIDLLQDLFEGTLEPIPEENKQQLYNAVIYGGRSEHDVLGSYRNFLKEVH